MRTDAKGTRDGLIITKNTKQKPNEGLVAGQRVKFTYNKWQTGKHGYEPVAIEKIGTFIRYSKGVSYTRKLVIKFDDNINETYVGAHAQITIL